MIKVLTPVKVTRAKCMDSCCDQYSKVARCDVKSCSLWVCRERAFGRKMKMWELFKALTFSIRVFVKFMAVGFAIYWVLNLILGELI